MAITIKYALSTAGQRASLLSGGNGAANQSVVVPPTDADYSRAVVIANIAKDGSGEIDTGWYRCMNTGVSYDAVPTVAKLLDDVQEFRTAKDAEREAKEKAEREEMRQRVAAWCALPLADRIHEDYGTFRPTESDAAWTPEYVEALAEC